MGRRGNGSYDLVDEVHGRDQCERYGDVKRGGDCEQLRAQRDGFRDLYDYDYKCECTADPTSDWGQDLGQDRGKAAAVAYRQIEHGGREGLHPVSFCGNSGAGNGGAFRPGATLELQS